MKLGVRAQLVLLGFGLIATTGVVADATLTRSLEGVLTRRISADLLVRLELVEREASSRIVSLEDTDAWMAMATDFARRSNVRVTIARADGSVLGESEPGSSTRTVAGQPEIVEALTHGFGQSTRGEKRMMFVAAPFRWEDMVIGVVRLGLPVAEVDEAVAQLRRTVLFGWILSMTLAGLGAIGLAQFGSRRVRALTGVARQMALGDLGVRTGVGGSDELSELGRTLDQLAMGLSGSLLALRSERDLVTGIFGGMQEGVLLVDAQQHLMAANPAVIALGIGPCQIGMKTDEAIEHGPLRALLERARSAGGPLSEELETPARRFLVNASTLTTDPERVLAVLVDVTQLRRLESMRRDFVANVSHELKTPLTAICSATETLQDGALKEPAVAAEFVEMVARNAERLQALVGDLLELAKVESGHLQLKPQLLELHEAVEGCFVQIRPRAAAKGVRLVSDTSPSTDAVLADARAFDHLLGNLVDNAVKFCPRGSCVTVGVVQQSGEVRVVVSDDGPGIPAEHLPRLFERFYRVDDSRSREAGGSGLGLAIARHLAEAMGGSVGVASTVGAGSSFWVTLPSIVRTQ